MEKAVIAKFTKDGVKYEVLVDPDLALEVRGGKEILLDDLLAVPEVFTDAHKGTRPQSNDLNKAFGTNDIKTIAYKIIREGEVQLTTEQRHRIIEEKTKAIANMIARQGINPQTNTPHPPDRILRAMEQAKVRIDFEKRPEEQIDAVLKQLQSFIPIKFEKVQVAIRVPAQYAARAAGIVRNFGTPSREEWGGDGSYMAVLEMAAGVSADLYDKLNSLTHGEVQVKEVGK